MKSHSSFIAVLLCGCAGLAHAQPSECAEFAKLRNYGKNQFAQIRGKPLFDDMKDVASTFLLPGARSCEIDPMEATLATYSCKWFVSQGLEEGRAEAKAMFEQLLALVVRCSPKPESLEKGKRGTGEWGAVLDTFPGQRPRQQRFFEVSSRFANHWWSVTLEYEANDDHKP